MEKFKWLVKNGLRDLIDYISSCKKNKSKDIQEIKIF